jgi:RNA polymerase sigma-54 factor
VHVIELKQKQKQTQTLTQRAAPALVVYAQLLALPTQDLEQVVERELAENPALEPVDDAVCPLCGALLEGDRCAACEGSFRRAAAVVSREALGDVPDEPTLEQLVLADLLPLLPTDDRRIAAWLARSLDSRGFLDADVDEAARALATERTRVERVLSELQRVAPPGVGARDVRESLLLQLERLHDELGTQPVVRAVIERHLAEAARGRHGAIAKALGCTRDDVSEAYRLIRQRLRPYPLVDVGRVAPPVIPDVVVRERRDEAGTFDVELLRHPERCVRVSPLYEQLVHEPRLLTPRELEDVRRQVRRARRFATALAERSQTLLRVTEKTVACQREFLRRGPRYLRPLTRAEVAAAVGVHESTVSRAVAGRWLLLPDGSVLAFARLFHAAAPAEHVLRRIIATEVRPLSDSELADELRARGIAVARRTAAKYRERLGIPPQSLR